MAAQAASFTVTTTNDSNDAGGCTASVCSLRDAVIAADTAGGTNTISLPAGHYTLSIAPSNPTNDATTGDLNVVSSDSLTISGAGASSTTIDGGGIDRVFNVATGGSLMLTGATVTGGTPASGDSTLNGGGILNAGTLSLSDDVVTGNQAPNGLGGGVDITDTAVATVTGSTFSSNAAGSTSVTDATGGGIQVESDTGAQSATLTVSGSTFTGNVVTATSYWAAGAAVDLDGGTDTITNSTLTGNIAHGPDSAGGAVDIDTLDPVQFSSDTVAFNSLPDNVLDPTTSDGADGAGVYIGGKSTVQFRNTIVTNNTRGVGDGTTQTGSASQDCDAPTNSNPGNNLDDDSTCFTGANDLHADPHLSALASNGGPTQTLAIAATSPARDHGDTGTCPSTDQRGVHRPVGSACDIGAFELDPPLNTAVPAISGSAQNLKSVSCSMGTWSGSPFQSYSYQWKRDGSAISGATSTSYTVTSADVGHQLTCTVTASTPGDGSVSATSAGVTATFPSNAFSFGKLVRNKHNGTAKLTVTVPGAGTVVLKGKGVKRVRKTSSGGKVKLKIAVTGKLARKLKAIGKLKVKLSVTYTPTGGKPLTKHKKITLILKP